MKRATWEMNNSRGIKREANDGQELELSLHPSLLFPVVAGNTSLSEPRRRLGTERCNAPRPDSRPTSSSFPGELWHTGALRLSPECQNAARRRA